MMKQKSILKSNLVIIIVVSISLIGCSQNASKSDIGNKATTKLEDDTSKTKENAKDTVDAIKDNIEAAGNSLEYTAMNFKDDVVKAGYKLKDSADIKKNYFKGNETDYLMGTDVVRLYEYNSAVDLEGDIKRIAPNGLTISGTDANYTRTPYYYRKGNSLIVYEGNEPAYVDEFKTMYGNAIIP